MERDRNVDYSYAQIPRRALKEDANLAVISKAIKDREDLGLDTYGIYGLRHIRYAAYVSKYPNGYPEEDTRASQAPASEAETSTHVYNGQDTGFDSTTRPVERAMPVTVSAIGYNAVSHQTFGSGPTL
jgi:hypothetical protein